MLRNRNTLGITRSKLAYLRDIYRRMGDDESLSVVAYGMLADYLTGCYGISYSQAAQLIEEFPLFFQLTKEVLTNMTDGDPSVIDTLTDDIQVTIEDVLTVKNELVAKIIQGNEKLLPDVRELLIAIYIRGFFAGAHMKTTDEALRGELMIEVVKNRLAG
jgi:hypothetical protein